MAPSGRPIEILHVDDDPMVLEFVKEFIKPLYPEMTFTTVESPQAALELLGKRSFDCIILDYKMPEMDGLAFAAKVREFSDTPIILYTGQGSEEVAEQAFAVGVDDYIRKENNPAHYQVLAKRIASVVEKKRVETRNYNLEKSTREKLEALHRHVTGLTNFDTLEGVAEYSFDIIERLLGYTVGSFGVVEDEYLEFIYARTVPLEHLPNMPLNGRGITVRAVKTGETQMVSDIRFDRDFVHHIELSDLISELDVPVKIGGKVVAVINLEKERLNAFSDEDRRIIEILGEHVASAISRIEHLKAIKVSGETYRRLLDSSLDSVLLFSGTKILYVNRNMAKLLG